MRKFLRFLAILIIGLALTVFAFTKSVTDTVLDKNTVKRELEKSLVYKEINDQIKSEIKSELKSELKNDSQLKNNLDEVLDSIFTVDILKMITDDLLTQFYNYEEQIKIDIKPYAEAYLKNFDNYIAKNNIELSSDVQEFMDELKKELNNGNTTVDITEYVKDVMPYVKEYKPLIVNVKLISLITAGVILTLALILSKERLKVLYKSLMLSGILLLIIRIAITVIIKLVDFEKELDEAARLMITIKDTILWNLDKFIIVFLVVGIGLLITKKVLNKNKEKLDMV